MAALAPIMMGAQTVMNVTGALRQGDEAEAAGQAGYQQALEDKKEANYRTRQHKANAIEAIGTANRRASEIRRQGDIVESDAAAAMAASGGVSDDAGAILQMARIKQSTEYDALDAVFQGDVRASEHRKMARSTRKEGEAAMQRGYSAIEEGKAAKKASRIGAITALGKGALSTYGSFKDYKAGLDDG